MTGAGPSCYCRVAPSALLSEVTMRSSSSSPRCTWRGSVMSACDAQSLTGYVSFDRYVGW